MTSTGFWDVVGTRPSPAKPKRGKPAGDVGPASAASAAADEAEPSSSFRRWASNDMRYWGAKQTHDALPAALYNCLHAPDIGYHLARQPIETDGLVHLPDSESELIVQEIEEFRRLKPEFVKRGLLHKRGVLLWGPPGGGKTTTIKQLIELIVGHHDGVGVFIDHPGLASECLKMLRAIEPTRMIIAIMEDFDSLIEQHGDAGFLALLDGETQIDGIIYIATTNYPERLDRRFVDRPSRFDTIRRIGMPGGAARRMYLISKEPSLSDEDLDLWVAKTDGFSIAHLRELIVLCRCFNRPLEKAIARLETMREAKPNSEGDRDGLAPFGFQGGHR